MIAHSSTDRKSELVELVTELDEYVNDASRHGNPIQFRHQLEQFFDISGIAAHFIGA